MSPRRTSFHLIALTGALGALSCGNLSMNETPQDAADPSGDASEAGAPAPHSTQTTQGGIEPGSNANDATSTTEGAAAATAAASPNAPTTTTSSSVSSSSAAPSYTQALALADLKRDMAYAGDNGKMTASQMDETAAAVIDAAGRYYPEQPVETIARIMIANIRQESDFEPANISGPRDGSGDAVGLLQVSPYGDSMELTFFKAHAEVVGLIDYRTGKPLNLAGLTEADLKDPWINVHVATWTQSNLARSGSADPSSWGVKRYTRPATYLTALGSWVAGPAADGADAYGNSGDNISAAYFKGILHDYSYLIGRTATTADFSPLTVGTSPVDFHR